MKEYEFSWKDGKRKISAPNLLVAMRIFWDTVNKVPAQLLIIQTKDTYPSAERETKYKTINNATDNFLSGLGSMLNPNN